MRAIKLGAIFLGRIMSYIWPISIKSLSLRFMGTLRAEYYRRFFSNMGKDVFIGCNAIINGPQNIKLRSKVSLGDRISLSYVTRGGKSGGIIIEDNVNIGDDCHITIMDTLLIDQGVLIGKKVTISDNSHGKSNEDLDIAPIQRRLYSKGGISIGKNVWISDKVTILAGVTIGEGVIIGANSVVTKNIEPFSVVAGVPAKKIL